MLFHRYISEALNVGRKTNINIWLTSEVKIHHGWFAPELPAALCLDSLSVTLSAPAPPRRLPHRHYLILHAAQALRLLLEFSYKRQARKRQHYDFWFIHFSGYFNAANQCKTDVILVFRAFRALCSVWLSQCATFVWLFVDTFRHVDILKAGLTDVDWHRGCCFISCVLQLRGCTETDNGHICSRNVCPFCACTVLLLH